MKVSHFADHESHHCNNTNANVLMMLVEHKEKRHKRKQLQLKCASVSDNTVPPLCPYAALNPGADTSGSAVDTFTRFPADDVQLFVDDPGAGDAMGIRGEPRQHMYLSFTS